MDKIEDLIASISKVPGAEDLGKKIAAAYKAISDEHDTSLGSVTKVTKERDTLKTERDTLKAERDKLKSDLATASEGKDDGAKKLAAERDDWRAKAEKFEGDIKRSKLIDVVGGALDIKNEAARKHAAETFVDKHFPDGATIAEGKLVGATKAIEQFKADKSFFWAADADADGSESSGPRSGSGPKPPAKAPRPPPDPVAEKRKSWEDRLFPTPPQQANNGGKPNA